MTLFGRPLTELEESDLIALKEGGQAERKTLDYKRDVVGPSDSDKREFLYDVSSFANSAGGVLIFGMAEKDGVPIDLVGLAVDPDKEILRLQQMLRAGVRPTLAAVHIAPVKLRQRPSCNCNSYSQKLESTSSNRLSGRVPLLCAR